MMWTKWRRRFKSHWFYWHTGHKGIAILSMMLSALVQWLSLAVLARFSVVGIIVALLLDAVGFWLAVIYLLLLRPAVPEWIGLKSGADALMIKELAVPILVGFFLNRGSSFLVAKLCGYSFIEAPHKKKDEPPPQR